MRGFARRCTARVSTVLARAKAAWGRFASRPHPVMFAVLTVALVFPVALWAQVADSGATSPTAGNMSPALGWLALKGIVIPGASAWLFAKWNQAQGALSHLSNGLKTAAFLGISVLGGILATLVGRALNQDPTTWTQSGIANVLGGIIATVEARAVIKSQKTKAPVSGIQRGTGPGSA